eukprot:scaffold87476_cov79-Phaeocystis_antarctica.AAC.1
MASHSASPGYAPARRAPIPVSAPGLVATGCAAPGATHAARPPSRCDAGCLGLGCTRPRGTRGWSQQSSRACGGDRDGRWKLRVRRCQARVMTAGVTHLQSAS